MLKNYKNYIIFIILPLAACQPKTYEDCVLEQMKNGNSDTAARIISRACEEKYGLPAHKKMEKEASLNSPAAEASPSPTSIASIKQKKGERVIGLESEMNSRNN